MQDAISDGANQILAKRTFKEVKDLEEGLDKNLPSGKEVVEQSKASSSIHAQRVALCLSFVPSVSGDGCRCTRPEPFPRPSH